MIGAIGVETGEEKRMKIIDKYFIKICNHNFECGCLFHGYDTYNINKRNIRRFNRYNCIYHTQMRAISWKVVKKLSFIAYSLCSNGTLNKVTVHNLRGLYKPRHMLLTLIDLAHNLN